MGSVCQKQDTEPEILGTTVKKNPKVDTITVPNNNPTTHATFKSSIVKSDQESNEVPVQQYEPKRGDKKKLGKIEARTDDEEIFENITKSDKKKSPFDFQLILNAFASNTLFSSLQPQDQESIVEKMFYCTTPDGQFVFKENDAKASSFFLIERGQCQIIIANDVKKVLKQSDAFGERALLYNAPRSASVKAVGDCAFWAIDRNTFKKMIEDIRMREHEENKAFMQNIKFFDFLTVEQINAITNVLFTVSFKKGEMIVQEGEAATSFFIIKEGSVSVFTGQNEIRKMLKGESFGEQALFQNSKRGASVKAAEENVKCLVITKDDLTRILGEKIQVVMYNNRQTWALERHPVLGKLTSLQIQKIVQNTNQFNYEDKQQVFEDSVKKLVIILEGSLIQAGNVIGTKGQIFGDKYFEAQDIKEEIVASTKTILAEIEFKKIYDLIGGTIDQVLKKNSNNHERQQMHSSQRKDYSHLKFEELVSIKKLGQGQFGNVYLVKNSKNVMFALKCISKQQIVEQHLEKHLAQEKSVLQVVQFPLIMQYYRSFQNDNYIFFLVEYIRGMELFDVIRDIGLLNTYDSQFYVGSLILCMEYLNRQQIVYRDIKPENIMVDEKGYMKLIDMGTAKFLNHKTNRTYTIIGTPHYMAPEILSGKGYTFPADLWSIGICMYEFMCGSVPYAEEKEDPYDIYEEIQKKAITYPSFLKDRKARKLMDQLLSKTPEVRLGGSFASLKANSWFDSFDWDKLLDREMKPPYVPPSAKMMSTKDVMKQMSVPLQQELHKLNAPYKKEMAKDPKWDQNY